MVMAQRETVRMPTYPSWSAIVDAVEGSSSVGMHIAFDTYTPARHAACEQIFRTSIVEQDGVSEKKTCEVFVELVLSLRVDWAGALADFRARRGQRTAAALVTTEV